MTISSYCEGRDNNFNLIRIVAAFMVLVTHCYAISLGNGAKDPLAELIGIDLGDLAVDIFFLTSGFLVTASLLKRQSVLEFLWARVLRIYPGLFLMILVTVFGLGLALTTEPKLAYLTSLQTWRYVLRAATLLFGVDFNLPGLFQTTPFWATFNGSLWTLPWEIRMYAILALIWTVFLWNKKGRVRVLKVSVVTLAVLCGILVLAQHFLTQGDAPVIRFGYTFFAGASIYVLKDRIQLSVPLFWTLLALAVLSGLNQSAVFISYTLALPYLLFFLAYVPKGWIRRYNKLGDYSYGVYIYAFPIQQTLAALFPGIGVLPLFFLASGLSLLAAAASWHLVESRALKLKDGFVHGTRKLLSGKPGRGQ